MISILNGKVVAIINCLRLKVSKIVNFYIEWNKALRTL